MKHSLTGKELHEVRPAPGIKIKRKKSPPKDPIKQEKSKVIPGAIEDRIGQELPIPSEEAAKIVSKLNEAKQHLMEQMKTFNKVLSANVLVENRSIKEKGAEQKIINDLVQAALNVENINAGEGLLAMCVLSIRQGLSLRDAGNRLAYKIKQLEQEVNELKKDQPSDKEKAKKELLERAKEAGLNVAFEDAND